MSCSYCKHGKKPITTPDGSFVRYSNYCDNCGEVLFERKPLTLNEFKQMDGEPVWVVTIEDAEQNPPYWAIVDTANGHRSKGAKLVGKEDHDDFGAYELYGETWVAYDRKPEEDR